MKNFCVFQPYLAKYHSDESGSSTAIIEYGEDGKAVHSIVIDTGSKDCDSVTAYKKVIKNGVIDVIIFTHPHEDHMGYFQKFASEFRVLSAYFPTKDAFTYKDRLNGRAKYIEQIRQQAIKECGADNVHYFKLGDSFKVGNMKCELIFQSDYKKLKETDSHHYPNNMSLGTLITMTDTYGRTWTYYGGGDNETEANKQFIEKYEKKPLQPDFAHVQWHGDQAASTTAFCKALKPKYGLMDFHHSYKSSGRTITINRFNNAGCRVLGNYLYGDIYCDIYDDGFASIHADKGLTKIKWSKYKAAKKALSSIQTTAYACKVFANAYGSGDKRIETLTALFGKDNAKAIQNRVNVLDKDKVALKYAFAASIINGYFGSGDDRKKNLGNYQKFGQDAVDEIYYRSTTDYDSLAQEIGQEAWGDNAGVIKVLTLYKKYEWSKVLEACNKNGVKIKN